MTAVQKTTERAVTKLKMTTQNFVQVSHTNFEKNLCCVWTKLLGHACTGQI